MSRLACLVTILMLTGCDLVFSLEREVCAGEECLTDLSTGEASAAELVLEGPDLFWTIDASAGTIRGCAIATCQPRSITGAERFPHSLVVDGDKLLWATEMSIRWAPRTGSGAASSLSMPANFPITALRLTGRYGFATAFDRLLRCEYDPTSGDCTNQTTLPGTLGTVSGPLTADAGARLWGATNQKLYFINDGSDQRPRSFDVLDAQTLSANMVAVFAHDAMLQVWGWPADAPTGTAALKIPVEAARAIGVDEQDLYVADTNGNVVRVSAREPGGAPTVIAAGLPPIQSLVVAPDRVYVIAEGRISWLPKPAH
ncbi:MAG: hypothetical protein IPQ07_20615 [Myxococcales bacterium]|nr:hypothetical protein [Myxococcales bacterium]